MTFGVSPGGFELKSLEQILIDIKARQKALFGPSFANDIETSVIAQLNGVFANEIADLWMANQAVWTAMFPETSSGMSLDRVAGITGTTRLPSTKGTVELKIFGTNGTVVPIGFTARVPGTDIKFETIESGTISGGFVLLDSECTEFGPFSAPATSLTEIFTPVAGVTSVTNLLDAVPGRNLETDADFRIRRIALLHASGSGTPDAIRADVLSVEDVDEARVFNNPTDATVDGIPPHAFEVVVIGGDNQDLFDVIGASSPAGIQSYGTTSGTWTDSSGADQPVAFTRPTELTINVNIDVDVDDNYPVDGDAQIKQAIVDYWNSLEQKMGTDVIWNRLFTPIYTVDGTVEVTTLEIAVDPDPLGTADLPVGIREIAVFDTSNITVTSTPV